MTLRILLPLVLAVPVTLAVVDASQPTGDHRSVMADASSTEFTVQCVEVAPVGVAGHYLTPEISRCVPIPDTLG
jgi:hypothetical protein